MKPPKRHAGIRPDLEIRHAADLFNRILHYLAESPDPRLAVWGLIYAGRLTAARSSSISRRAELLKYSKHQLYYEIRRCKSLLLKV